jgi:type II secretory pathway pseudopilin PulG
MTLVEVLLVMALLVVIGSIVVPVFTGSFASMRLRRAGDQVLTRWSQARAAAIETGDVLQFRFTPETGTYQIDVWTGLAADEAVGSSGSPARDREPASDADASSEDDASSGSASEALIDDAALPDQIVFHGGQLAASDPLTGERQVAPLPDASGSLSTPLLFYPDGTTSEASVVLANDRRQYIRLSLRRLTGVGRATGVLTQDELQRWTRR